MRLPERVAIVSGGSSGIGRGICLELARAGAKVVVADISEIPKRGKYHDQDVVTPTATEIEKEGGAGTFVQVDMGDPAAIESLVEQTVATYGRLDIVVNNAGIHIPGNSRELSVADWDRVIAVNLRGLFIATKYALPHLERSAFGRIINIASVHAFAGGGGPAYAPAKAGVVNLTRDTAVEVAAMGITVNAICPGYIETPIQDYLTEEQIETCRQRTPLPRLGLPSDIGKACLFFASDDADWITGTALPVDGGMLAPLF